MELLGRARRRRWSWDEKARIVGEASAPGMSVSFVARRYDLAPSQVFAWRRQLRDGLAEGDWVGGAAGFLPVEVASPSELGVSDGAGPASSGGRLEIALANGHRLFLPSGPGGHDAAALLRLLVRL